MIQQNNKIFESVRASRPGKSAFNLSYTKMFTCDMGQIIPIMCDEIVPGDIFSISNEIVVRMQPSIAPLLHQIDICCYYFNVPHRLMGEHSDVGFDWEAFITGGVDGLDASTQPVWDVTLNAVGTLWDYLGLPIGIDNAGARPVQWIQIAYNMIWNQFFRDQNLDAEVTVDTQEAILHARWPKDYFTSALPFQQRGTFPAIAGVVTGLNEDMTGHTENDATERTMEMDAAEVFKLNGYATGPSDLRWDNPALAVTGFDIDDLRLSMAIQRWQEANARGGARYKEFIQMHYGVTMPDSRAQRCEYIGGSKGPLITSEVLQTSQTDTTPQGTLGGHGISVQKNQCAKFRATEFGIIMGLMVIRPVGMYHEGIDRQWLRESRYEYYSPEFAGLSEQAILERELYAGGVEANNRTIFGYQGRYDEMRTKRNYVCGDMHTDFDFWHCCRQLGGRPTLNTAFVNCDPRKDFLAVDSEDAFMVSVGNIIRAIRPLPVLATPGGL